jgi:hypothetical protein
MSEIANQQKNQVLVCMKTLREKLSQRDQATLQELADLSGEDAPVAVEALRKQAIQALDISIQVATNDETDTPMYHSRDPLAGLIQSNSNATLHNAVGDALPAVVNLYGQGDVAHWTVTGIDALIEHFKSKAEFVVATDESVTTMPPKCTVALIADWGADNVHAQRIGSLIAEMNPDFLVHLGDIYYSGARPECETFLRNWPLRDEAGLPRRKKSFALNGNHEMYSRGRHYFGVVLPAFEQEASYMLLQNENWQIFGLDTAYVPFSINGSTLTKKNDWKAEDARLQSQFDFILKYMKENPKKRNVFLSHHQPYSSFAAEFEAAESLRLQFETIQEGTTTDCLAAWYFGHEHRRKFYDDKRIPYKARLIGNGAIPHDPQTETTPEMSGGEPCMSFDCISERTIGDLAMSGFVVLTLDGEKMTADYIDEDGKKFKTESI